MKSGERGMAGSRRDVLSLLIFIANKMGGLSGGIVAPQFNRQEDFL